MKFYKCEICGKIVEMIEEAPVPTVCCGQPMGELHPGTTDGAVEKHLPVVQIDGNAVHVCVGSAEHPMTPEHSIRWIALETKNGVRQCKALSPDQRPVATFWLDPDDRAEAVYEYCNLHGLWTEEYPFQ